MKPIAPLNSFLEQTTVSRRKQIAHIMKNFDFSCMAKTMKKLEWTWGGNKTPTVAQLKKVAKSLLNRLVKDSEVTSCSTGGLCASVDPWGHINLAFVVTDWDAGEYCSANEDQGI